jgi:hypothetical protein
VATPIPKAALSTISAQELVGYVFSGEEFAAVSLALNIVKDYLQEAASLQRRMTRARREIGSAALHERPAAKQSRRFPFRTVHFYANCWTIIGLHLHTIRDVSRLQAVGRALRPHIRLFDRYRDIRNHYEHLNERLPGQKNQARLRLRHDFGNLFGNMFTVGGEKPTSDRKAYRLFAPSCGTWLARSRSRRSRRSRSSSREISLD